MKFGYFKFWKVKWVEIGNEDWFVGCFVGFELYINYCFFMMMKVFNEKYFDIKIIVLFFIFDNMIIFVGVVGDYYLYLIFDEFVE